MNPVEIEQAVSELSEKPFDPAEFPFEFLLAFGNKKTTVDRLRKGNSNKSDVGGLLQRNQIHLKVSELGQVEVDLDQLRASPATAKGKARFIVATDGEEFQAEDLTSGQVVVSEFQHISDEFGFFAPLAGISAVKELRESTFDIKATGRLNRLYVQILKDNPDWDTAEKRGEMNHFMARLIFCFFAEDTDIFGGKDLFTNTLATMTSGAADQMGHVLSTIFEAMDTKPEKRGGMPSWADQFPYVNGGLFAGSKEVPAFTKRARSYLVHIGKLDWTKINPDIFGSMIQAIADDDERESIGMHYTSVPNILKVLNPLFLDDLREQLEEAGDNSRKLLNLRKRISRIRVFDPACGSGNFLVIAYKQMREIENQVNFRRGERGRKSDLPLTNFRGIEVRDFAAEVARLALIIAEYQCDAEYLGQKEALAVFLPLTTQNWITSGNALAIDWQSVCPPVGKSAEVKGEDLFTAVSDGGSVSFDHYDGEVFVCGNPPYKGARDQNKHQKEEIRSLFGGLTKGWKSLDYVSGWFLKGALYCHNSPVRVAFVATNSICQGAQVPILWPTLLEAGISIHFGYQSFKWSNLAANKAGVSVVVVGFSGGSIGTKKIFSVSSDGGTTELRCDSINPYLIAGDTVMVDKRSDSLCELAEMTFGNTPIDGGNLLFDRDGVSSLGLELNSQRRLIRKIMGSDEFIKGKSRFCLWITDEHLEEAKSIPSIEDRIERVREVRLHGGTTAKAIADKAHQFQRMRQCESHTIIVPSVSSETRDFLPVGLIDHSVVVSNLAFALYDAPLWNLSIIASRLHLVWITTVCGKLETRFRYSNTLGWNTFPIPVFTKQDKEELRACAEQILLAREQHFPASIADLYDSENMPSNLRDAHQKNDEVVERIYIGRRFKNDTERLEKVFDMYTKMTQSSVKH